MTKEQAEALQFKHSAELIKKYRKENKLLKMACGALSALLAIDVINKILNEVRTCHR